VSLTKKDADEVNSKPNSHSAEAEISYGPAEGVSTR
jgi:hypothetical protein